MRQFRTLDADAGYVANPNSQTPALSHLGPGSCWLPDNSNAARRRNIPWAEPGPLTDPNYLRFGNSRPTLRVFAVIIDARQAPRLIIAAGLSSDVIIKKELIGMRAQANFVDLARPLIAEVGFHHIPCEDISFEKELVIGFKCVESFLKRAGG